MLSAAPVVALFTVRRIGGSVVFVDYSVVVDVPALAHIIRFVHGVFVVERTAALVGHDVGVKAGHPRANEFGVFDEVVLFLIAGHRPDDALVLIDTRFVVFHTFVRLVRVKPILAPGCYLRKPQLLMLLKIFLIVVLLIVFVPTVRRFLFYLLVGRQLINEQRRQHERNPPMREGETRVKATSARGNGSSMKGGEYVDYEEVN